MSECRFEALGAGRYRVSGELGFATVPAVWEQSRAGLNDTDRLEIDLGAVTNVDSAGLAGVELGRSESQLFGLVVKAADFRSFHEDLRV